MKKLKKLAVLWVVLFSIILGGAIALQFGLKPMASAGVMFGFFVLFMIPKGLPAGILGLVTMEVWEKDIENAIFKDNTFINEAKNEDQYVLQGKVVHIPQSGGPSFANIVKNRTGFPATTVRRADSDVTYALDTYTSDPVVIPFIDQYELSYDKRQSVLGEQMENLIQTISENLLYTWASAMSSTYIINASGAPMPASAPSATGTRSMPTLNDLQSARTILAKQNKFKQGKMVALIPSALLPVLFPANDLITATYMATVTEEEKRNGILYKVHGFRIKERSSLLVYDSTGTLKAPGAAGATGDCEGIMLYNTDAVCRAKGEVKMFAQADSPTEYGDVYSFLVRMGGRIRRSDGTGLCVIVSNTVSQL